MKGRTQRYYDTGSTVPGKSNSKKATKAKSKKKSYQKEYDSRLINRKKRAELVRLNRELQKKGRSRKGDGKDISHKSNGKITLEKASKNRGSKTNRPGDRRARGGTTSNG